MKKYKNIIKTALVLPLLFACAEEDITNTSKKIKETEKHVSSDKKRQMSDGFTIIGDSVLIPSFEIKIRLSANALKVLKDSEESIVVQAYFTGEMSKEEDNLKFNEEGANLGSHRVELFDTNIARFSDVKIPKEKFDQISNKNFEVLINVFSGRHSTPKNLIDCDILQEKINNIKGKQHTLEGELIGRPS
ncbi:MAG: hypothetical protein WED10_09935 [Brumimicrobium sp.]